jgi:uncharacterized protein (DUF1499 family)
MAGAEAYLRGPLRRSLLVRRIREDPTSRLAMWSRRFATFAVVVTLLAIVIGRAGFLEIIPSLAALGGALILSVIAVFLAIGAFVVIWRDGLAGFGMALVSFVIGVGILAYPAYLGSKAYRLPAISDITTDPIDPPRFEAIARLRGRDANPTVYAGLRAAELQKQAYPGIQPIMLPIAPEAAFEAVMSVMSRRKLRPVDARAPQTGRPEGRVEVVFRTPVMGFRDDVVIRIRSDRDGSRVDLRSTSRYGRHDFGTNAARIAALSEDIEAAAEQQIAPAERNPDLPAKGAKKGPEVKVIKPGEKRR